MAVPVEQRLTPAQLLALHWPAGGLSVAVTGATGWLGASAVDLLVELERAGHAVELHAYASRHRSLPVRGGRVPVLPLEHLPDARADVVLHFAYLGRDLTASLAPEDFSAANLRISDVVLRCVQQQRPRAVVFASSGAAAQIEAGAEPEPYGRCKLDDEVRFADAVSSSGSALVVPRIYSLAGRRANKTHHYALGSFAVSALLGQPVRVRARGPVVRSYCDPAEVVALSLWQALLGAPSSVTAFSSGGTVVEVGELAHLVADRAASLTGAPRPDVVRAPVQEVPPDVYVGDVEGMARLCGRSGLRARPLPDLVGDTLLDLAPALSRGGGVKAQTLAGLR